MGIIKRGRLLNNRTKLLDFKNDRDATLKLMSNVVDWFDIERVRAARVLVVGAGAIGNEVLKNLALLGVGQIHVFDRDSVEMSNLSRSVLYRAADAGQPKASAAARALRELNPSVSVRWHEGDIAVALGLGLIRRMDVVVGCLDNRDARYRVNRACWKVDRPWVDAGIGQLNGQVRAFRPGYGACYECLFTKDDYKQLNDAAPCDQLASRYAGEGKIPTTPTIASLVAAVQVQEMLKLLDPERWDGRSLVGREFVFNGTVFETSVVGLALRLDCPPHEMRFEPEHIVELPEARAAVTTGAELLALARERLGETARIFLGYDLIVEKHCPACKAVSPVLRPERGLFREDMVCEHCGHECALETCADHVWELERESQLGGVKGSYQTDILDRPVAELGIPPLHILEARNGDGRALYLELSGDEEELLTPNA